MQSEGLSSSYLENVAIRSVIRNMMALALVPEQSVPSLFDGLNENLTDSERTELSGLFQYFHDFWMRQISLWNVYKISDRTNNYSEGMVTLIGWKSGFF